MPKIVFFLAQYTGKLYFCAFCYEKKIWAEDEKRLLEDRISGIGTIGFTIADEGSGGKARYGFVRRRIPPLQERRERTYMRPLRTEQRSEAHAPNRIDIPDTRRCAEFGYPCQFCGRQFHHSQCAQYLFEYAEPCGLQRLRRHRQCKGLFLSLVQQPVPSHL